MSLRDLQDERRLRRHRSSPQEIANLISRAQRDLQDARVPALSLDGRFVAAYHAALSLATTVLAAAGYRAGGEAHHATVFEALPLVMGEDTRATAAYYDACRRKRNRALYDRVGQISSDEVEELIDSVREFMSRVKQWLQQHHPELYPISYPDPGR